MDKYFKNKAPFTSHTKMFIQNENGSDALIVSVCHSNPFVI